ncbi:MAG: NAD-dependent deacylase [Anaerolineales bacterium]|jgi:NAD-dependent deacetylase
MSIKGAASQLQKARYAVVLTGAGISTPSGIPDFRSTENGLWQRFNPMEVASLTAFRIRPDKFFNWFRPLAKQIFEALPNPAHKALARLEKAGIVKEIITQNIDGLHHQAGSQIVHEVHGTLNTLTCGGCFTKYPSQEFVQPFIENGQIPKCKKCNSNLKPDAVLFEEQLPLKTWLAVEEAIDKCDLLLVAGSSLEVVPVARLPYQAASHGAGLIIVNHTETYIDSRADFVFHQDVIDVLPLIADELT